jgi:folate-binding protein YgfZ
MRTGALVQEASGLGTLLVTGSDRTSWLNGLVTCDLAPLSAGAGAYGIAVAKNGKILSELIILLDAERILLAAPSTELASLQEHFERHLIMEDANVAEAPDLAWLLLHGPRAGELVGPLRDGGAVASAVDTTGLGGVAAALPPGELAAKRDALLEAAGEWAAVVHPEAWESLRVELGVPRFGVDFTNDNYPQEAALERLAVSFEKGCYLGQETVFMLQMRGHVKKKLVQLAIEGDADVAPTTPIFADGTDVGAVTSRTRSPDGAATIALGYVKYKYIAEGTELKVLDRPAQVISQGARK